MFGKFMVSFDVESFLTNIPLEECIDLAVNYISEDNPDLKLSESELRSLFLNVLVNNNACYVGETTRHFSTRVREHLVSDIFKHLENSEHCRALCSVDCFHILDHASTRFRRHNRHYRPAHANLYTTRERSPPGIGSFTPNKLSILREEKTNLMSKLLQYRLIKRHFIFKDNNLQQLHHVNLKLSF